MIDYGKIVLTEFRRPVCRVKRLEESCFTEKRSPPLSVFERRQREKYLYNIGDFAVQTVVYRNVSELFVSMRSQKVHTVKKFLPRGRISGSVTTRKIRLSSLSASYISGILSRYEYFENTIETRTTTNTSS